MADSKKYKLESEYGLLEFINSKTDYIIRFNGNNSLHYYISFDDELYGVFSTFISIMRELFVLGYINDMTIKSENSEDTLNIAYVNNGIDLGFSSVYSIVSVGKTLYDTRGLEHFDILFSNLEDHKDMLKMRLKK